MPTYRKVGTFLFKLLDRELQAGRKAPEFVHHATGDAIMNAFKAQFESYTRQYPPFSARQQTWTRPINYWQAMSLLPEASVLAIKKSKSPTLNWRSVRDLMKEPEPIRTVPATTPATDAATSSNIIPPITRTAACEDGLAAVNFVDPDDTAPTTSPSFAETEINSRRDGVDITLPFFRDLLSDKPIPGAHEIGSLGDWQETAAGGAKSGSEPLALNAEPEPGVRFRHSLNLNAGRAFRFGSASERVRTSGLSAISGDGNRVENIEYMILRHYR
ncbi:hypothetical protein B0H19DRAFT_1065879 [Mycena capillaripes]|nr:hypothetical protein B0H19DRAFT_1065879 [Mycena capillaripes]